MQFIYGPDDSHFQRIACLLLIHAHRAQSVRPNSILRVVYCAQDCRVYRRALPGSLSKIYSVCRLRCKSESQPC